MPNAKDEDSTADRDGIRAKVRLDVKGIGKPGRLLFGGKSTDKAAEEAREQQVTIFRHVPIQGVRIEDIDVSTEVYIVPDEINNSEVAYAPLVLTITADSLENVVRFITREDFRKIEIIEPPIISMNRYGIERLLFRIHEELMEFRSWLERKYNR